MDPELLEHLDLNFSDLAYVDNIDFSEWKTVDIYWCEICEQGTSEAGQTREVQELRKTSKRSRVGMHQGKERGMQGRNGRLDDSMLPRSRAGYKGQKICGNCLLWGQRKNSKLDDDEILMNVIFMVLEQNYRDLHKATLTKKMVRRQVEKVFNLEAKAFDCRKRFFSAVIGDYMDNQHDQRLKEQRALSKFLLNLKLPSIETSGWLCILPSNTPLLFEEDSEMSFTSSASKDDDALFEEAENFEIRQNIFSDMFEKLSAFLERNPSAEECIDLRDTIVSLLDIEIERKRRINSSKAESEV